MIEKTLNRYVVANSDTGSYLKAEMRNKKYEFVSDIELATKSTSTEVADMIMSRFYEDVKSEKNLVVVPLKITYELLDEDFSEDEKDMLELENLWAAELDFKNAQKMTLGGKEVFVKFL